MGFGDNDRTLVRIVSRGKWRGGAISNCKLKNEKCAKVGIPQRARRTQGENKHTACLIKRYRRLFMSVPRLSWWIYNRFVPLPRATSLILLLKCLPIQKSLYVEQQERIGNPLLQIAIVLDGIMSARCGCYLSQFPQGHGND